jgi:D-alanyl-D-alanine dipeptidase
MVESKALAVGLLIALLCQGQVPGAQVPRAQVPQAKPPVETGNFRKPDLVDLATLGGGLRFDIRYATANNFMGMPLYSEARAFLEKPAAEALLRAGATLRAEGYGLLIFDAYRPWYVTRMFWEATPEKLHGFVANPRKGSKHNRACAVDLSLYYLNSGAPVAMPSAYDEMTPRAHPNYPGGTAAERARRDLLCKVMTTQGFTVDKGEWWHFDYRDWQRYPILNIPFAEIRTKPGEQ